MNKAELVESVAEETGLSKTETGRAVDSVFSNITKALQRGNQVTLVGFGSFMVRQRAARTGHNPQTGQPIQIAASKAPAFKPGKALKDAVN